jgi:hypothetical protein
MATKRILAKIDMMWGSQVHNWHPHASELSLANAMALLSGADGRQYRVHIAMLSAAAEPGDTVALTIDDTGEIVSAELLPR